uniref:Uncharacterized protein n=1 Tax=Ananas comosus var. bracteatus TaxID=296719 RepID=A0A6V7NL51_ANACO|nr:unnamed protein product [Ananas comosus var. bracteatus]
MVVMGLISRVLDAAVVAFSAAVAVAAPLIDAQALVPARLVPAPVAELRRRYAAEFGDYLVAELPCSSAASSWSRSPSSGPSPSPTSTASSPGADGLPPPPSWPVSPPPPPWLPF